ncbi:MAG: nucleoside triphosphate pyrophosphohydrolase [bacterium]|nr:nucleoside triphosphate pyrophosphohydrolase [bacterium]
MPDGCPWDREQTCKSITPFIIEEAYELVEAINNNSYENIKEELGDVLLHVVMLSVMAEEESHFFIEDVINNVTDKMIRRHPHVFSKDRIDTAEGVRKNWEKIKKEEKKEHLMDSIPGSLPALMQAELIQSRVSRAGFDWNDIQGPLDKIVEEIEEVKQEIKQKNKNKEKIKEEFGDVLFSLVNFARKAEINPEEALKMSNKKFISRFKKVEELCEEKGVSVAGMGLDKLEELWQKAKKGL